MLCNVFIKQKKTTCTLDTKTRKNRTAILFESGLTFYKITPLKTIKNKP